MEKKKIFISSCKSMLTKERKNLRSILYQNEHLLPICMEKDFLSDNSTSPLDVDKQYIEDSDAVICILSFLYGELIGKKIENIELCPLKEFKCKNCCCSGKNPICTISFTEFEYHYAKKLGKLVYVIYNEELDNNNAFEDHIKRYKEKEDYLRNMYNNHKEKNMVFLNTAKQNFCYHYESKKSFRENCDRVVSHLIDRFGIEKKNHAIEKRQISKHLSGHLNKQNFKSEEKYFDELALEVIGNKRLNKLIDAILLQHKGNIKKLFALSEWQGNECFTLDRIYGYILQSVKDGAKHPLVIEGGAGTGKSTILSLLYYMFYKESECNKIQPFIIDVHYYDNAEQDDAVNDLNKWLNKIKNRLTQDKKTIIFIDGINYYKRGNEKLARQIRNFISDLNTSRDVSFVASIGEDSDYPDSQYKFFERNSFIKKIKLEPIENKSELFKQLVKQILQYYNDEKDIGKMRDYITQVWGKHTYFRTAHLIIKECCKHYKDEDFFKKPIGIMFDRYFDKLLGKEKILDIAKYVTKKSLGNNTKNPPEGFYYLYKSEPIKNYFLAYYYIYILEDCNVKELKKFNYVFTHRINTFVVDLMNADTHKKNKIVENIQKLMSKEIDREQKIQLAFMLGRIKCDQNDKQCKVKAQNILKTEWEREFIKEQDEIYIRTLGISLISLGYNCHENDFYKHLINKKEASKINRNFHIQYFLKEGWHLDLTNDKDCTSGDIDYLWWRLRASIFNKKGKKEYLNINIISILNLSLYKILLLEEIPGDKAKSINKTYDLTESILEKTRINETVREYVKKIQAVIAPFYNREECFTSKI